MKARAISIRAGRAYIQAVNDMAQDLNTTTADLVKTALDEKFGPTIEQYELLRAERAHKYGQLNTNVGTDNA